MEYQGTEYEDLSPYWRARLEAEDARGEQAAVATEGTEAEELDFAEACLG